MAKSQTTEEIRTILINAVIETVTETGTRGAPGGVMYAALLQSWPNMTADQFTRLMAMVMRDRPGVIVKRGDVYYATDALVKQVQKRVSEGR